MFQCIQCKNVTVTNPANQSYWHKSISQQTTEDSLHSFNVLAWELSCLCIRVIDTLLNGILECCDVTF